MNYKNAKIYKLTGENGLCYYGSTIRDLNTRLIEHRCKSKKNFCITSKLLTNPTIELLENYPCNNKIELLERERWYIENNECVNRKVPNKQRKEHKQTEKYKAQQKEYNQTEKRKAINNERNRKYRNIQENKEYRISYDKHRRSFFGKLCKIF